MMGSSRKLWGLVLILLCVAAMLSFVAPSTAWASVQAYSITSYSSSEWDYYGTGVQDVLSGTIWADPSLPDGENILSATITMSQPSTGKSYTASAQFDPNSWDNPNIWNGVFGGPPYAHVTSSAITVSDGLALGLDWTDGAMLTFDGYTPAGYHMEMNWNEAGPQYSGGVWMDDAPYTQFLLFGNIYTTTPQDVSPDNANMETQASTWVIATAAPEPSTFALLSIATITAFAYTWRRRRTS